MNNNKISILLRDDFYRAKEKNPAVSLRSYAKKLGLNHAAVSQIMKGERKVGLKVARRICDALMLEPVTYQEATCVIETKDSDIDYVL